jgi:hypothetical protein
MEKGTQNELKRLSSIDSGNLQGWAKILVTVGCLILAASIGFMVWHPVTAREGIGWYILAIIGIGLGASSLYDGIQILRGKQTMSSE